MTKADYGLSTSERKAVLLGSLERADGDVIMSGEETRERDILAKSEAGSESRARSALLEKGSGERVMEGGGIFIPVKDSLSCNAVLKI